MNFELPPLVPGKTPEETTVVVAMSGGVDSSCVAALCQQAGYKTIGITLQLWDYTPADASKAGKKFGTCCALDDVYDARRVCQTMGMPHYVVNMERAFKEAVIDDFVESYLGGETPIPCVRCNQRIKFDAFLEKAKELGADVLVTGHYVRKAWDEAGKAQLLQGVDPVKDQSYYLFTTTPEQLEWLNFPLGSIDKTHTRQLAKDLGLHVHKKKDSYDICFVPEGDYRKVVSKFAAKADANWQEQPGNLVRRDGTVLGQHAGILGYTVGQRKGIGGGHKEPLFVLEIRPDTHEIVVGTHDERGRRDFFIKDATWLVPDGAVQAVSDAPNLTVKVRAQHTPVPCHLAPSDTPNRWEVTLMEPDPQIAPGQAAVFYDGDRMLGGGFITLQKPHITPAHSGRVSIA